MEKEIITGFNSLATMIAEKVMADIKEELSDFLTGITQGRRESKPERYIRGNNALAKYLGVSPLTVCNWKSKGILDDAIKSEIGRVIIYDTEKVMEALNHRTVKPGRPKLNVR